MAAEKRVDLYDDLGADYDLMINWSARMENEMPFFTRVFSEHDVKRVLDSACATGMHAISLAKLGYEAVGADPSAAMIEKARANARDNCASVRFVQAGFGELASRVGVGFGAVLCLGNSLPHVIGDAELEATLSDMYRVLSEGGVLIIQNRNYDKIWPERIKYMPLNSAKVGDREVLFFRMLEFHESTMTFSIVTLQKSAGEWSYTVSETTLRPIFQTQLEAVLRKAGFGRVTFFGDYGFTPFRPRDTMDLIVVAEKLPR